MADSTRSAEQPKKSHHSAAELQRRAERKRQRELERAAYIPPCGTRAGYDRHRLNKEDCTECRQAESARRKRGTCSTCGKRVHSGSSNRAEIVCHECRRQQLSPYGPHAGSPGKYRTASCEECGSGFRSQRSGTSPTGWTRYCSRPCVTKARGYTPGGSPQRNRWAAMSEEARARKRHKARQRHRTHQLTYDGVSDEQILERDGWRCRMDKCLYRSRAVRQER